MGKIKREAFVWYKLTFEQVFNYTIEGTKATRSKMSKQIGRREEMIELKNISFEVPGMSDTKGILKNINLKLEDNKFIVITGPNGGGKSTLAKIIAGIEKPTSGQILIDGEDITEKSITERAKAGVSYAFQQPVRFKGVTVFDLIKLAKGEEITIAGACEYLSAVGLCARDYVKRQVDGSLSGGELKRIEIATVLARGTRISLFDEPEVGIDLWSFQNLIRVFEKMHEKIHGTILIISHQERILNIADEIVVIADGEIRNQGSKESILPGLLASSEMAKEQFCEKEAN